MVPPFQAAIWLPGRESRRTFVRHFPMGGVIYLSMVVRRVAIRFRLSYYGQGDPGYSAAAYPEDPCEPAPALASRARLDTLTPWLKVPKTHTRARRQLASCRDD